MYILNYPQRLASMRKGLFHFDNAKSCYHLAQKLKSNINFRSLIFIFKRRLIRAFQFQENDIEYFQTLACSPNNLRASLLQMIEDKGREK